MKEVHVCCMDCDHSPAREPPRSRRARQSSRRATGRTRARGLVCPQSGVIRAIVRADSPWLLHTAVDWRTHRRRRWRSPRRGGRTSHGSHAAARVAEKRRRETLSGSWGGWMREACCGQNGVYIITAAAARIHGARSLFSYTRMDTKDWFCTASHRPRHQRDGQSGHICPRAISLEPRVRYGWRATCRSGEWAAAQGSRAV